MADPLPFESFIVSPQESYRQFVETMFGRFMSILNNDNRYDGSEDDGEFDSEDDGEFDSENDDDNDNSSPDPSPVNVSNLVSCTILSTATGTNHEDNNKNDGDDTCCICLCAIVPGDILRSIKKCKHKHHAVCLEHWLARNQTCPLCRVLLLSSPSPPPSD